MAERRREVIGGWLVVEDPCLPWDCGIYDHDLRLVICGEIGHVRWLLFLVAAQESVLRDVKRMARDMADRLGIEYSPGRDAEQRNETDETH